MRRTTINMTITEYLSLVLTNATLLGYFASRDDSCCVSIVDRMYVFTLLST